MAFLGPFFFLIYGLCNWITAQRSGVGSFYWEWERSIPFVPLMIFPYMSLDLFYAGSTFLCRNRAELLSLARRMVFAILTAGVCFLLFPLRFAFTRPETTGLPGLLFSWLQLDAPFNQAPSLHIALLFIVFTPYGRRTTGPLRALLIAWFFLIGISALLTWQHHFIDLPTGVMLTTVTFYLIPEPGTPAPLRRASQPHPKLAAVYSAAAALFIVLAKLWSVLLLWPAVALALVAAAYAGCGPGIFEKTAGRLRWAAAILLAPYLLSARLFHWFHHRLSPPRAEIAPRVILGRRLNQAEAEREVRSGVTAVLDLTAEYSAPRAFRRIAYLNLPVLDLTVPEPGQVREGVRFIREQIQSGTVYVHCALGHSRSAGTVAAYLLAAGLAADAESAVARIRAARPRIVIGKRWMARLQEPS
jgi:predicted protein tyrosine phosphatase